MRKVIWRNLIGRRLRLLLSAFAIILGVSFVSGSLIFTNAIGDVFDGILEGTTADVEISYKGANDFESVQDNRFFDARVVDKVRELPEAGQVWPNLALQSVYVIGKDDKVVGGNGPPGLAYATTGALSMSGDPLYTLEDGTYPSGPGEVALDVDAAEKAGLSIGDEFTLVTPADPPTLKVRLAGTVKVGKGGLNGATITLFDRAWMQKIFFRGFDVYTTISVSTADGVSQDQLATAAQKVLPEGITARTGNDTVKENQKTLDQVLGFLNTFLLVFAAVSLVVGTFLIINTFSILVAQRSRELALLRALGASRRQVNLSVIAEAVGVGLIGATLGLLGGYLLAQGLSALFKQFGADFSSANFVLTWPAVIASYAVGIVVTTVAAYAPARRASRIPPVAALNDDVAMPESTLHRRVVVGVVLVIAGVASMTTGLLDLAGDSLIEIGAGMLAVLVGVALLSPIFAGPVIAVFGQMYRGFGTVGRLATENSLRNPRRTAATASALMVGLALMAMMSIFGSSASASTDAAIEKSYTSDLIVSNVVGQAFSPSVAKGIREVDGVTTVAALRYASGKVKDDRVFMIGVDARDYAQVVKEVAFLKGRLTALRPGAVLLSERAAREKKLSLGDTVTLQLQGGSTKLKVAGIFAATGAIPAEWVVSHETLTEGGLAPLDSILFIAKAPDASQAALTKDIEGILADLPTVTLKTMEGFADEQRAQTNQFLTFVNVLLALSVFIAALGVVNTLALSVIERTREVGLLRAIGMSRRQLRTMIRLEAIVIAVFGALLGVALGIAFGTGLVKALKDEGITDLSIPWPSLVVMVAAAVVIGVAAAVLPARRAANLDVLKAVTTE